MKLKFDRLEKCMKMHEKCNRFFQVIFQDLYFLHFIFKLFRTFASFSSFSSFQVFVSSFFKFPKKSLQLFPIES